MAVCVLVVGRAVTQGHVVLGVALDGPAERLGLRIPQAAQLMAAYTRRDEAVDHAAPLVG